MHVFQEMNPPKYNLSEDMANLSFLNEAAILYNLRARYAKLMIYVSDHNNNFFHNFILLVS